MIRGRNIFHELVRAFGKNEEEKGREEDRGGERHSLEQSKEMRE